MAQRKPEEKVTLNQLLHWISQLSLEEQGQLRQKLDETWVKQWDALASRVRKRCAGLAPLTDEEIMAEVKAVREAGKARRAEVDSR